jgi:phosphoribosylformylglycinamidine synthase subunit PurS
MNRYRVAVHIVPRKGILDPQGEAVAGALRSLGFADVHAVRVGRHVVIDAEADDESRARDTVSEMCRKLLANPVTEDFEIAGVNKA